MQICKHWKELLAGSQQFQKFWFVNSLTQHEVVEVFSLRVPHQPQEQSPSLVGFQQHTLECASSSSPGFHLEAATNQVFQKPWSWSWGSEAFLSKLWRELWWSWPSTAQKKFEELHQSLEKPQTKFQGDVLNKISFSKILGIGVQFLHECLWRLSALSWSHNSGQRADQISLHWQAIHFASGSGPEWWRCIPYTCDLRRTWLQAYCQDFTQTLMSWCGCWRFMYYETVDCQNSAKENCTHHLGRLWLRSFFKDWLDLMRFKTFRNIT